MALTDTFRDAGCPILCRFCKGRNFAPPHNDMPFRVSEPRCRHNLEERQREDRGIGSAALQG